jgi:hypothetical protein
LFIWDFIAEKNLTNRALPHPFPSSSKTGKMSVQHIRPAIGYPCD